MKKKEGPSDDSGAHHERHAHDDPNAYVGTLTVIERIAFQTGYAAGYRAAELDQDHAWTVLQAHAPRSSVGPSLAELEERRWGPGGREHFADPRPGDYPGRLAEAS